LANRRANPASTPHFPFCGQSSSVSSCMNGGSAGENSGLFLTWICLTRGWYALHRSHRTL
jgi:hypothetical protein